ncbi:MAG: hypothetical protein MJE77_15295 [Proteobacteria bacterium]|nr:hypothetical protein [Pseudomonadota bacterium]
MADQAARNEFDAAVQAIRNTPDDLDSWDIVESLAESLNCPDEVASLYKESMAYDLPRMVASTLGERAAGFIEEWFGDDPTAVRDVLLRVLEIDPGADWAFQRLTEVFTVTENWNELLSLYDHALKATRDDDRRIQLLDEAAQVAKDIANQPDKAISYLQKLVPLKPGDSQLENSLERLLERYERWADLIDLWDSKLLSLPAAERDQSRVRIAACWLDNLSEPGNALDAVRPLLSEGKDDAAACELLERIVTCEGAAQQVRQSALDMLRLHYETTDRPREIVRVLEAAIAMASPEEGQPLREEAAARLSALDEDVAAMDHYAALLALVPTHAVAQERMLDLARRSSEFARYAEGIAAAAAACENVPRKVALLAEAARIRLDMLEDESGAIELYQAALSQDGLPPDEEQRVARRLAELLARADRLDERLGVLERLAAIENSPATRRTVLGEAARLAEGLGETDRALALWQTRIDDDADDVFALDATIALLESNQRWEPLIESLDLRVAKATSESQRRADLVRIAIILDRELNAREKSIDAWVRVQNECGENAETVDALAGLLSRTERWSDLVELLERASDDEIKRVTRRLSRLSDAYRSHLDAPDRALNGYRNALAIDSTFAEARRGLTELLDVDDCRARAATTLAEACRENEDWDEFLKLLAPRLADARSPQHELSILREAADIQENKVNDPEAALASLARAYALAPKDRVLEADLVRLAEVADDWSAAERGYREAAERTTDDLHEVARLRLEQGKILSVRLDREAEAHEAFMAVLGIEPGNLIAAQGVVRIGTRLGHWDQVATAVLAFIHERNSIEDSLFAEIEYVASATEAFDSAASAFATALDGDADLPAKLAFQLHQRIAIWHRDRRGDNEAAEAELLRALGFDGTRVDALRDLAALQRSKSGRAFFATLRRLADANPADLDVQQEAAEVAIEHFGRGDDARSALTALLGNATAGWRGTAVVRGQEQPDVYVKWAIERLVEHYLAVGNAEAAVDLLIDSSRLPFDSESRRSMRYHAAEISAETLGNNAVAIEMYRSVLSQTADDVEAMERLAELYQREGRVAETLALRRHQLNLAHNTEVRLRLRLDIAALVGEIEARGGRREALLANLDDQPGHGPSIDALYGLLDDKGEYAELADLLEDQARKLGEAGDSTGAAGLWARAARVAENHTDELDRAITGYRRVAELAPTPESLDSLARLYMERGQPALAVTWLENLLVSAGNEQHSGIVYRLAKAHLGAGRTDRAISSLESHIDDQVRALELRALLADLYRKSEKWESLARLLTSSLPMVEERKTAIAYAREAASIYSKRLDSPNKAIPALEKALSLLPGDRTLRTQLAIGLRVAGRNEEARDLLLEIIEEFGRRRNPERAQVHVELALVHQALGKDEDALAQMELASKMDTGNVRIQRRLAELAREAGKLDKAERTYRALLLVVRRKPPGDDVEAVGVSEVLYELHKLADERQQGEQAKELLETALETAVQNDAEVRRLRRSLLAHGERDTLLRVFDMRLEASEEATSKAELLADKADLLAEHMGQPEPAMHCILDALKLQPMRADLHDTARTLSKRSGKVAAYAEAVTDIADNLRRKEDPPMVAELLMRAGDAVEHDAGDLEAALRLYKRVEELGERKAEAYYAISRVAGALGDTEEQTRVLEAMLELARSDEPSVAQVDALYRLSEVFVNTDDRRSQGISLLEQAFDGEPRYSEAGRILKTAAAAEPGNDRIMTLYERVARSSTDSELLLDFLERRAHRADASPGQIREAVRVAVEHNQSQRAESLLVKAVEAARNSGEGTAGSVWALISLAEYRIESGDIPSARDLIYEIATFAEPDAVRRLALAAAARAGQDDKHRAAELYEFLRQRDPSDPAMWKPLIGLYRELGDSARLQNVIAATLPTLTDPGQRNTLRMQQAQYLIEDLEQNHDAIEILRDVLLDDPDHLEAAAMLEHVLRKEGDEEALVDFLWQRFDEAKSRQNPHTIGDVAMRLGALLDSTGSGSSLAVYRDALAIAPDSRQLLRAVYEHLDPDEDPRGRADLLERLIAVEEPAQTAELASSLIHIWESLDDINGVQRALELGYRANPGDNELHQRIESFYHEHQKWPELATLMAHDAEYLVENPGDIDQAVSRLREAAAVYRDTLSDIAAAASVLGRARELAPHNDSLVAELAACLSAGGDVTGAVEAISTALAGENPITGTPRIDLLLLRSDLQSQLGHEDQAIADLEEAYLVDAERIRPQLIQSLANRRTQAEQIGEREVERASTMRLVDLLGEAGHPDNQRAFLIHWVEREPGDRESLYRLRDMDAAAENWDGVLAACLRLVELEQGDAQVEAALGLAEAAEMAGRPGDARPGLEAVHYAQPGNERIRNRLRRIYELSDAHRELAGILLADGDHAEDEQERYDAYRRAAEVLVYQLGDAASAIEPARKARELRPDSHDATVLFVDVLTTGGQTDEAIAVLEPAIGAHRRRSPQLAALQQRMARIAATLGDHDSQLAWLKKSFDVDRKNGEIAAELAQLAYSMGDFDLALKPLRAITLMEKPGPITRVMALLWEARIEYERGNRAKAELWAKKALREDPGFTEAQEFLNQIQG